MSVMNTRQSAALNTSLAELVMRFITACRSKSEDIVRRKWLRAITRSSDSTRMNDVAARLPSAASMPASVSLKLPFSLLRTWTAPITCLAGLYMATQTMDLAWHPGRWSTAGLKLGWEATLLITCDLPVVTTSPTMPETANCFGRKSVPIIESRLLSLSHINTVQRLASRRVVACLVTAIATESTDGRLVMDCAISRSSCCLLHWSSRSVFSVSDSSRACVFSMATDTMFANTCDRLSSSAVNRRPPFLFSHCSTASTLSRVAFITGTQMQDSGRSPRTPSTFGWNRESSSQMGTLSRLAVSATYPAMPAPGWQMVSGRSPPCLVWRARVLASSMWRVSAWAGITSRPFACTWCKHVSKSSDDPIVPVRATKSFRLRRKLASS
mmetsp:Transcript_6103/g.13919  ORF Transcript_6103/g.13919 Transcript_6103/m.13919 type:complete len:383 (+) Transcript_6103:973-2121(+)